MSLLKYTEYKKQWAACGHLDQNPFLAQIQTTERIFGKHVKAVVLLNITRDLFLKW